MAERDYIRTTIEEAVLSKARRYIDDPSEAPEGVEVHEGPQGGLWYQTEDSDGDAPDIEVTTQSPESFAEGVNTFIGENDEMGLYLTEHSPEEMQDHTLLSVDDGAAGVAISPDGDIQNLYNNDGPDGAGRALLEEAVKNGGRTLDCYDGFLPGLYREFGFREVGRMEFDPNLSPEGWEEHYDGPVPQPDVVFMAFDPEEEYEQSEDYYEDWGQAKEDSRDFADWSDLE